ncbi:hypothetical protein EYZ11_004544 [Aspergillus tanneri]|uniref:Uncharacterized protein n=1 Tax=Aspergillus tanneri TaxID=1220188 RepID=A0A4S3JMN5_9EURO|nr:hypothetical protein EYZ11_004544 [Aspergillus tanneri]
MGRLKDMSQKKSIPNRHRRFSPQDVQNDGLSSRQHFLQAIMTTRSSYYDDKTDRVDRAKSASPWYHGSPGHVQLVHFMRA